MKLGDRIEHHAYGPGMVLETEGDTVRVLWDYPELGKWPGEASRETFWTDISDVSLVKKMVYYALVHDHKHGQDMNLYSTYNGAQKAGVSFMREISGEWGEDVSSIPDDILWRTWPEISGDTEFFSIEELELEG